MSNPLADMDKPDVIFCIGTNMTECHPVAATGLKKALANGAKMIVADPRRIELANLADVYLPIRVGSDTALLLGMAHVIAREGLVDEGFMRARTTEGRAFLEHVGEWTPEWAAEICEVPAEDIEKAAILYGTAERGAIYYTLGITEHICGVENVQSLCNVALMTGNIGREGTGINPMRGQNNIQGAGDAGALPNNYPGFQPVTDPTNQEKFEKAWGTKVDLEDGITKVTALEMCGDQIRAMYIDGENTLVSDPDRKHCEHALRSLDLLVVTDLFMTETAELADVVFPAAGWAEVDGTQTNTERRIQRLRGAVPPPGEAMPDWWITSQLAKRMGFRGFDYEGPEDVFNELCELSPTYQGVELGQGWSTVNTIGRSRSKGIRARPACTRGSSSTAGGSSSSCSTGTRRRPSTTSSPCGSPRVGGWSHTIHGPKPGAQPGSTTSSPRSCWRCTPRMRTSGASRTEGCAIVSSRRGSVRVKVQATSRSPKGTVFTSFSFGEVPVNVLTGSGYDPITHTAELKVCPVRLEPG